MRGVEEMDIKKILMYASILLNNIWNATYNILTLIVFMILLVSLLQYYIKEYSLLSINIQNFINIVYILGDYWKLFWVSFFLTGYVRDIKDLNKTNERGRRDE
jgi:hypothetical protein